MKSINFSTGVKEYIINGDSSKVIRINGRDPMLAARICDACAALENSADKYGGEPSLEKLKAAEEEIRESLKNAFGFDIVQAAFGEMSCLALNDKGEPVIKGFLEELVSALREDFPELGSGSSNVRPEVQKYLPSAGKPELDVSSMTKDEKNALIAQLLS
ncbi:MAG: hypothetical protein LIO40_00010 [Ruminococcus sp.]|nr:hypothetical protein [Ruminococcus sp.]